MVTPSISYNKECNFQAFDPTTQWVRLESKPTPSGESFELTIGDRWKWSNLLCFWRIPSYLMFRISEFRHPSEYVLENVKKTLTKYSKGDSKLKPLCDRIDLVFLLGKAPKVKLNGTEIQIYDHHFDPTTPNASFRGVEKWKEDDWKALIASMKVILNGLPEGEKKTALQKNLGDAEMLYHHNINVLPNLPH